MEPSGSRVLLGGGPAWYSRHEQLVFAEFVVLVILVTMAMIFETGHHYLHHALHRIQYGELKKARRHANAC